MSGDMFTQYSKERLLKRKQNLAHVKNSLEKFTIGVKTKPLSFQGVGHESGHPKVTWLGHLVVPFGRGKC